MAKPLYLYTYSFPYGKGEAFLEEEIDYLAQSFGEVVILPLKKIEGVRSLPNNIRVVDLFEKNTQKKKEYSKQLSFFLSAKIRKEFLKDGRFQWSYCGDIIRKSELLIDFLRDKPKGIHYSYWFEEWALILSLLTAGRHIDSYLSRAHGFDLYEERAKLGYNPWRKLQLGSTKGVYSVSHSGADYLKEKFPTHKSKVGFSYLGTKDFGLSPVSNSTEYHVVSCSNVIPLKSVDRIVQMLTHLKESVKWTHIGDGVEMKKVQVLAKGLPENISVNFLGSVNHQLVLDFYSNTSVDCFVNLSTTEGLPVSMMEAISFGIPILATDVGGVSEIVTDETGILVSSDFQDMELSNDLQELFKRSRNESYRKGIRSFWENNFSAAINFPDFCEQIKQNHAF